VQQGVSRNPAAQRFLFEAHQMELTDGEWGRMAVALRRLRGDPGRQRRPMSRNDGGPS
jgi:hypothetical protein